MRGDLVHFLVGDERAVHAHRHAGARRHVQHVAVAEQLLGAHLVEDGARVDLGRDLEGDAGRDVGLDQAGDDVHRGPLRGQDQVDAGRARLLRQPGDQFLHLLAHHHHHVGQLVDDDDDERQRLQRGMLGPLQRLLGIEQRIGDRLARIDGLLHLAVVVGDVAHTERRHQPVAAFHLADTPAQRIGGLFHVGDHRCQQVRDALVDRQLEHLRVMISRTSFGSVL